MINDIDDFNSEALKELSEIADIDRIGLVIGAGYNTIVFKPDYYLKQNGLKMENPCLIVTKEKEKFKFLKKLIGNKVKKLKKCEFYDENLAHIEYLESYGWNLFYIEKMEKYFFDDNSKAFKVFQNLGNDMNSIVLNKYNVEYYLENIKELIKKYNPKEKGLYISIKKAFTAIKNTDIKEDFQLDIHSEQFLIDKNKLICIDPFLFNYKSLNNY